MNYLLDTHTYIWLDMEPTQLSERAAAIIANKENILLLSHASIWEIQIKIQLGKLRLSAPLATSLQMQQEAHQIEFLSISLNHIFTLESLPHHHRDPFDRLLIAQAISEGLPIFSRDLLMTHYPIKIVW